MIRLNPIPHCADLWQFYNMACFANYIIQISFWYGLYENNNFEARYFAREQFTTLHREKELLKGRRQTMGPIIVNAIALIETDNFLILMIN